MEELVHHTYMSWNQKDLNHLGDTPLLISIRPEVSREFRGKKTHPCCGRHLPKGWGPGINKKGKREKAESYIALFAS